MKNFRDIFALVKDYKSSLVSNFLFNILNAIFSLFTFLSLVPFLNILFEADNGTMLSSANGSPIERWINDGFNSFVSANGKIETLAYMCVYIVIMAFMKNLVNYISLFSIAKIRTAVSRDLREKMYKKVLDLPVSYFSNERKGDILSRMTNDLMEIEFSVIGMLEALLKSPVLILVYMASLFLISWKLTVFSLIFLPVSGYLIAAIAKSLKNAAKRGKGSLDDLISITDETITGNRILKVFNAEKQFKQKFDRMNDLYFRLNNRRSRASQQPCRSPTRKIMRRPD